MMTNMMMMMMMMMMMIVVVVVMVVILAVPQMRTRDRLRGKVGEDREGGEEEVAACSTSSAG